MARSLSTAKLLAASVSDSFSAAVSRRGYTVAAHGTASSSAAGISMGGWPRARIMRAMEERAAAIRDNSGASSAWTPDPATGYYRPANRAGEIDAAQLRAMLLSNKK